MSPHLQQLRANMREMEKLCGRVRVEDAEALENLVHPVKERASAAAREFLKLHTESTGSLGPPQTAPKGSSLEPSTVSHSVTTPDSASGGGEGEECGLIQTQIPLPEIPQDMSAAESWETLEEVNYLSAPSSTEDLLELNGLVNEFSELVHVNVEVHILQVTASPSASQNAYMPNQSLQPCLRHVVNKQKEPEEKGAGGQQGSLPPTVTPIISQSQQAKIDSIEDNVEAAAVNVEAGTRSLGKVSEERLPPGTGSMAVKYKMAVLPVAGAVLGGVVGGPLGLLAGFKVAGVVAAVSGGLLGYVGGNAIQKTRRANVDQQLQQLSQQGASNEK
ncbi:hypothetical protein JZ751_023793 [Albula glossodonta]|uniref:t-SNARE coiled-coil homology domain-containing protein n=1 Tax=Albula glossodonta TaxID=121402 RepID=A0A8T2NGL5_9TELE|nr:hypothetical protein JZ751_023793 [Albula glossodonta]